MNKILIPLLSVLIFSACNDSKPQQASVNLPSLVNVAKLNPSNEDAYYEYPATTSSDKDVILISKASGEIKQIFVKDGDEVKKDQIIALIDDDMAKAQEQASQADLKAAEAELNKAFADYKRTLALKASTSKKDLDLKTAAYLRAQASVQKAQAALKIAQINLNHTKILAPFDGKLGKLLINLGEFVTASNSKIVRISNAKDLRVDFYIPDNDREKLGDLSQQITATFNYLGKSYQGVLSFVDSNSDLASIKAYANFKAGDVPLNSFVKIKLLGIHQNGVYKINKENLLQDINGYYVYLKRNNTAEQIHIDPIFEDEKFALIKAQGSKIQPGDELILDNYKKIHPGSKVATDAEFAAMMKAANSAKTTEASGKSSTNAKAK